MSAWISNFIPHCIVYVIIDPCWACCEVLIHMWSDIRSILRLYAKHSPLVSRLCLRLHANLPCHINRWDNASTSVYHIIAPCNVMALKVGKFLLFVSNVVSELIWNLTRQLWTISCNWRLLLCCTFYISTEICQVIEAQKKCHTRISYRKISHSPEDVRAMFWKRITHQMITKWNAHSLSL